MEEYKSLSGRHWHTAMLSLSRSLFCAYGSQIRRHNVSTGELVSVFDGHDDEVTGLCINEKNQLQVKTFLCTDLTLLWSVVS